MAYMHMAEMEGECGRKTLNHELCFMMFVHRLARTCEGNFV